MIRVYRTLTDLCAPFIRFYLGRRKAAGKEDPARFSERFGHASHPRPEGPLVWLHAASIGEAFSLLSLVERLNRDHPALGLLMTTGTVSSAGLMADRLPPGVIHQYLPLDRAPYAERFLDHWLPDVVLWSESELWPNLLTAVSARGLPLILINGRISVRSLKGWQRVPSLARHVLSGFTLSLGQTAEDAERLKTLGANNSKNVGNLKHAAAPLPADEDDLKALQRATAGRPMWLAASTHAGEETLAGDVHRQLSAARPKLLTLIAPRHPGRSGDIKAQLEADGFRVQLRSVNALPEPETDIYLADTLGEMGLLYRLSSIVFMGKSIAADGGQNPFEAVQLGCAVLHGPRMSNFRAMTQQMAAAGATLQVPDAAGLTDAVGDLLENGALLHTRCAAARAYAAREAHVLDRIIDELAPFITPLDPGEPGDLPLAQRPTGS